MLLYDPATGQMVDRGEGPQGVQGPPGTPGTDGADGADGADGPPGNSTIIVSPTDPTEGGPVAVGTMWVKNIGSDTTSVAMTWLDDEFEGERWVPWGLAKIDTDTGLLVSYVKVSGYNGGVTIGILDYEGIDPDVKLAELMLTPQADGRIVATVYRNTDHAARGVLTLSSSVGAAPFEFFAYDDDTNVARSWVRIADDSIDLRYRNGDSTDDLARFTLNEAGLQFTGPISLGGGPPVVQISADPGDHGNSHATNEISAVSLAVPADSWHIAGGVVECFVAGIFVGSATATRRIRLKLRDANFANPVTAFDSTALVSAANSQWVLRARFMRSADDKVRYSVELVAPGLASVVPPAVGELTVPELFTNAMFFDLTFQAGGAGAAINDIVSKLAEARRVSA